MSNLFIMNSNLLHLFLNVLFVYKETNTSENTVPQSLVLYVGFKFQTSLLSRITHT